MSDSASAIGMAGTVSPRNVDTVAYIVVAELPYPNLPPPGERMLIWPQGEVFVSVNGGLRPIKQSEIEDWEKSGLIERATK